MSVRPNFSIEYVNERLMDVDAKLTTEVTAFIAGGTVMAVESLKEGTKDIDIVVETPAEVRSLKSALVGLGYSRPSKELVIIQKERRRMTLLENQDRFRWDIFEEIVAGKFHLSPGMKQRAQPYKISGEKLHTKLLSMDDVFLMKSVTGRDGDIDDMAVIAEHGVKWDTIVKESDWQSRKTGQIWENSICEALEELRETHRISSPVERKICRSAEKKIIKLADANKRSEVST